MSRIDEINAILDDLGGAATFEQVEYALRDYGSREVMEVLADRAAAGAFNGGTISDPLIVELGAPGPAPLQVYNSGGYGLTVGANGSLNVYSNDADEAFEVTTDNAVVLKFGDAHKLQVRGATAAPADAALAAGSFSLWLDQTNGAAKLKIKAKQANGTVVQGEVALT
jgi:hypothetical protein